MPRQPRDIHAPEPSIDRGQLLPGAVQTRHVQPGAIDEIANGAVVKAGSGDGVDSSSALFLELGSSGLGRLVGLDLAGVEQATVGFNDSGQLILGTTSGIITIDALGDITLSSALQILFAGGGIGRVSTDTDITFRGTSLQHFGYHQRIAHGGGEIVRFGVQYRMVNDAAVPGTPSVPLSVTITTIASTNVAGTPTLVLSDAYGCVLETTASAAGDCRWRGTVTPNW